MRCLRGIDQQSSRAGVDRHAGGLAVVGPFMPGGSGGAPGAAGQRPGMYATCTVRLSQAVSAPYLAGIARVFVSVALAAWAVTLAGMVASLLRQRPPPSTAPPAR